MSAQAICGLGHANVPGSSFCSICGQELADRRVEAAVEVEVGQGRAPKAGRRPSNRALALLGLGVVIAVALVVWFPVRSALNSTTVPDVLGMSSSDAESAAATASLGEVIATSEYSNTVADGLVISQDPAAGQGASKGTSLTIVVSQGPRLVTMTVTNDISSGLTDLDFDLDCSTYIMLFSGTYNDSIVVDENNVRLSGMTSAGWSEDSSNGTYLPCNVRATFEGVPDNRAKYRVNLSIDDPENNNLGWVTGDEARAQDFQLVE